MNFCCRRVLSFSYLSRCIYLRVFVSRCFLNVFHHSLPGPCILFCSPEVFFYLFIFHTFSARGISRLFAILLFFTTKFFVSRCFFDVFHCLLPGPRFLFCSPEFVLICSLLHIFCNRNFSFVCLAALIYLQVFRVQVFSYCFSSVSVPDSCILFCSREFVLTA